MAPLWTRASVAARAHEGREVTLIVDNIVYRLPEIFMSFHPGGSAVLMCHAGLDATSAFQGAGHSAAARARLRQFECGRLTGLDVIRL